LKRGLRHETGTNTMALLIVLSGPSGVGKDAILSKMRGSAYPLEYIVTVTTRAKRAAETDNVDYHFVSKEAFQKLLSEGGLLEWAKVYGNLYGVPREPVKRSLDDGKDTIIKTDVQGAATIKNILPQAVFIFVEPPSPEELVSRLRQRRTESSFDLALRIKLAEEEMEQIHFFDYRIINRPGKLDQAVSEIGSIITAEKCRVHPRNVAM